MVVAGRPIWRAAVGSEQWRPEQTRPERLVDHAVAAGRASGYASGARTASRSSCAHGVTARRLQCPQGNEQRLGRVRGYRAGSCAMSLSCLLYTSDAADEEDSV